MNKKKVTLDYISHTQNTSPAKLSFSFSKTVRFPQNISQSPAKFYEKPEVKSRRATSLGYGSKSTIENKNTGDPGLYNIKRSFNFSEESRKGRMTTFGMSHKDLIDKDLSLKRLTPGPGNYKIDPEKKIKFHIGEKLKNLEKLSESSNLGPQRYFITPQISEKYSKFKNNHGFRIKTQASGLARYNLSKYDNHTPGPNKYNPESSMNIESLMKKGQIRGAGRFCNQARLKKQKSNLIGPGSYESFSVFGLQSR